jgi:outer membrane protein assembly factor BamA
MKSYKPERKQLWWKIFLSVALLASLPSAKRSQAIAQEKTAECPTYTVRRVEFIGDERTRDHVTLRRIPFREGKALSDKDIERTIKRLNRIKSLEKLKREDIGITYVEKAPAIPDRHCYADILIHVREKKQR